MAKYTNNHEMPLALAVMLATDNYDHEEDTISATGLIRPLRQLILAERVPLGAGMPDLADKIPTAMGTAIHDASERAWLTNWRQGMLDIGYPESVVDTIVINPTEPVTKDQLPIYLEQRAYKEFKGFKISGKFDMIIHGELNDTKRTSVYTYLNNSKNEDYILQGSIYRWLNPDKILEDHIRINYVFSDWSKAQSYQNPQYPKNAIKSITLPLMSLQETEQWISKKLGDFARLKDADQELLPLCTDKELWRGESKWRYYKNPAKMGRATRVFDNIMDAYSQKSADNNVGIIVEKPAEAKACLYCPAYAICTQKDTLIADGTLKLP